MKKQLLDVTYSFSLIRNPKHPKILEFFLAQYISSNAFCYVSIFQDVNISGFIIMYFRLTQGAIQIVVNLFLEVFYSIIYSTVKN